jgi:hypothetical protein
MNIFIFSAGVSGALVTAPVVVVVAPVVVVVAPVVVVVVPDASPPLLDISSIFAIVPAIPTASRTVDV